MTQIYIFGDLGGWYQPFREALKQLPVSLHYNWVQIPEDVCIVQVGDLVRRGPQSEELVDFVYNTLLRNEPGRWIQLLGNHEGNYLGGPVFGIPGGAEFDVSMDCVDQLRHLRRTGLAGMAAAIKSDNKYYLITHAGLTLPTWSWLGNPATMRSIVQKLNALSDTDAFTPGWLLGGGKELGYTNPVGVAWAHCGRELYPSWDSKQYPQWINQIHGHSSPYLWNNARYEVSSDMMMHCFLYPTLRHTKVIVNDITFWAIDQGLGTQEPWFDLEPLHLEGTLVEYPHEKEG